MCNYIYNILSKYQTSFWLVIPIKPSGVVLHQTEATVSGSGGGWMMCSFLSHCQHKMAKMSDKEMNGSALFFICYHFMVSIRTELLLFGF